MDDEKLAEQEPSAAVEEDDEREYEIEPMETEDLDEAMREALDAVERSQEQFAEAAAEAAAGAAVEPTVGEAGGSGDELERLEAELADLRNRSVRTLADFDNYRKRVARERADERRYAGFGLAQDILAVVDNLERALGSEGSADDLKQGVEMTLKQLHSVLGRHGIARVEALGELFDPSLHEAVMRVEEAGVDEPRVHEELQSGYLLHERLLRPSMVKVAVPATESSPAETAPEPEAD
jgi:molecular chaperone GrpE